MCCRSRRLGWGQFANPYQPYNDGIKQNKCLPDVKMRPFIHLQIPLSDVEEANDAHQVQDMNSDKTKKNAPHFVGQRRAKSEYRSEQNDGGFNTVTASDHLNTEAGLL